MAERPEKISAISVTMPQRVIDLIDEMAEKEQRNRSNMLSQIVERYDQQSRAMKDPTKAAKKN